MSVQIERIRYAVDCSAVGTVDAITTSTDMISRDEPGSYAIGVAAMVASAAWTMGLVMKMAMDADVIPDVDSIFAELVEDMRPSVIKAATAKLEGRI